MQKGDNKGKANKSATAFPAYDAQRGQNFPKGGGKSGWKDGRDADPEITEAGGLTQAIQVSLNGTRKAEQRVSSLSTALSKREQLWAMYEKDMAAAYKKEHARFFRDMARIREDLQKATVAQAEARKELVQVFYTGGAVQEPESDVDVVGMMRAWRANPAGDDVDSILQRAARAMGAVPASMQTEPEQEEPWWPTAPNFGGPPPGLEPRGSTAVVWPPQQAVHVEPTGSDYTAPVAKDPHVTSPSAARGPTPINHFKAPDGSRVSVKTRPPAHAPDLGGIPLSNKLEAKRSAMAPFGFRLLPGSTTSLEAGAPAGPHVEGANGEVNPESAGSLGSTEAPFMSDAEIQARTATFAETVNVDSQEGQNI